MTQRSLATLLKVRRAAVIDARAALVRALAVEDAAATGEAACSNAIQEQLKAASAEGADDAVVAALATWLTHARKRQGAARERRHAAEAATATVRAALVAARVAEAVIDELIKTRAAAARLEAERRAETERLEDIAARPARTPD